MKALLGDYPCTAALKQGKVRSEGVQLDFADVRPPSAGFKRVVRGLEFDVAELAITTFLMAKAAGKPYRLLPAVVLARMQHPRLVCNSERRVSPPALEGKRITRVFVTHMHPDHVGMAGWLTRKFDCPLWMTKLEYLNCRVLAADTGREAPADLGGLVVGLDADDEGGVALPEEGPGAGDAGGAEVGGDQGVGDG